VFVHANLTKVDFAATNLSNANLSNAALRGVLLGKAYLKGLLATGTNGTPGSLPMKWFVQNGTIKGPGSR